ncbi:MAG TPA: glycosyl hydrolase family 79 C-terminal domain-containing protein [Ktedonobacterales bacterium]|nr:glycosyl hydrolase family 79 C-terminal domain-containing protein [Ktedonobacterales bacterium]
MRQHHSATAFYSGLPRYQASFLACLLCCVMITGCTSPPPSDSSPVSVTPKATLSTVGGNLLDITSAIARSLPTGFMGLSIELDELCNVVQLDAQNSTTYEQLYHNLGIGTLRIGGNTADFSQWEPDGQASCDPNGPIITKALVDTFFAFVARIHWRVVWGLNLLAGEPGMAASEAAYVAASGGDNLMGFTIGNEPDLYVKNGYRPTSWTSADFYAEWSEERDAILALVPSAEFIGPEVCCGTSLLPTFAQAERTDPALIGLSHHYYLSTTAPPIIDSLLDPAVMQQFATSAANWISLAKTAHVPLDITESNSFSNGGKPGVSNTLAAVLWLSDYLLEAASLGVGQADLHNGPGNTYDVIDDNGAPTVLYYALLLVHTMINHARLLISSLQTKLNLTAYASADSSGAMRVVLINKEKAVNASIKMNIGQPYQSATSFQLTGPGLAATTQVTLGTRTVSTQGTWTPSQTPLTVQGQTVTMTIPASSAVCITLR